MALLKCSESLLRDSPYRVSELNFRLMKVNQQGGKLDIDMMCISYLTSIKIGRQSDLLIRFKQQALKKSSKPRKQSVSWEIVPTK